MKRLIAMARFDLGWPLSGIHASAVSALILGVLALAAGEPVWMPFNATTHAIHGPEAADVQALDLLHTGLGGTIHVLACFFWSGIAVLMIRMIGLTRAGAAWLAGLATALLAGVVDYGLLPARLSPGWELILPWWAVGLGFVAMGVGIALGLNVAAMIDRREMTEAELHRGSSLSVTASRHPAERSLALERLRRPRPDLLDRRGDGNKQRGDPPNDERSDI